MLTVNVQPKEPQSWMQSIAGKQPTEDWRINKRSTVGKTMEFTSSAGSAHVVSSKFRVEDAPRIDLFNVFRPTLENNADKTAVVSLVLIWFRT